MLLIVALVAIIFGCVCLILETDPSEYPGKPPYKNLPPVQTMSASGLAGPAALG